jgi:hypothetical protein
LDVAVTVVGMSAGEAMARRDPKARQREIIEEYEVFLAERRRMYVDDDDIGRWESDGGR